MRKYFIILLLGLFSLTGHSQKNDPVVMKVDGKEIKKSEFEYLYKKNNTGIALDEYLELFKNFKLKVAEAQAQGIDTTATFVKELKDNRSQLAKQYIKELAIDESLLLKEYERLKEEVEISHIAIPIKLDVTINAEGKPESTMSTQLLPADTLAAYKKAIQYRNRLLKGEKIEKIAAELDKNFSIPNTPPTYMGWMPGMSISPFLEDAIHATTLGSVSMPVRFHSLYLIFKVHNKRESAGEINASHIMVACPQGADVVQVEDAQKKADEIYKRVISGEDFAGLAKELSDDKGSGQQGGELGWFGSGRMVKEFETTAFALQEKGDISKPVKSQFGFHIIKLNDKRSIESFEDKKAQIINVLGRSEKANILNKPGIDVLKEKTKFVENDYALEILKTMANSYSPSDSVFQAEASSLNDVLFFVGANAYTIPDFMDFVKKTRASHILSTDILNDRYEAYVLDVLKKEEDNQLEQEYDDFRNLMREYHDGFLSYEVTQNEIWEKAPKDTLGLTTFFNKNREKYSWESPRYRGYVVLSKDKETKKAASKKIKKKNPDDAAKFLLKEFNTDSVKPVKIIRGLFSKGENPYIDEAVFKTGKAEVDKDYPQMFVIGKLLKQGPELYSDVGGLVISDYQNEMEQEWLQRLREKYTIEVYPEVLKTIE